MSDGKRAKLLPTGEPREKKALIRLNETEWKLLDIASTQKGMKLGTYIAYVALMQACDDMQASTNKQHRELVAKARATVKVEM